MFGLEPLTPAYGRDYKTHDEVVKAFMIDEKDFVAANGQYCSIRDVAKLGLNEVTIRYDRLRKLTVIFGIEDWREE